MVKLIIEDDEGKTTVVPLIRDEITIGRKEGNTIRLTERNVSRKHAKLLKQNSTVFIEDLDSYNGIKVNGNKIAGRVAIAEGDRIQIGDYVLGLKMEGVEKVKEDPFTAQTTELPPQVGAKATQIDTNQSHPNIEDEVTQPDVPMPGQEPQIEKPGRLVCLSNNFPGQEWQMDKSVMVVGRTEDNDIVINHRSISRHHARITEENGAYTIIDLQSSNGVRINGEEYGKVVLRRGDLIDLGHVRLRFVAPDEDFVFDRDASIVDISKVGRSRGGLWAGIIVVSIIAVVFLVWQFAQPTNPIGAPDSNAVATGDIKQSMTPPAANPAVLVANINQAVGNEQWNDALKNCALLKGEPRKNAEANCQKAIREKEASEIYEQARRTALQNNHLEALRKYKQIPADSIYKSRDSQVFNTAKTKFLADARKQLDEQLTQKDCESAKDTVSKIKEVDPSDTEAEQKAKRCSIAVAVKRPQPKPPTTIQRPPTKVKLRSKSPKSTKPPKPKPTMDQTEKAKQLLSQSQQAYIGGNHRRSIKLAQQVLKLVPGHPMAYQILGACYCYMKNKAKAQWAYDRLQPRRRNFLKTTCLKNGINLQ